MHSFTTEFTIKNSLRKNNSVRCWNCKSILTDGDLWRNKQLSIKYDFDFDVGNCLCDYCTDQRAIHQHENFNDQGHIMLTSWIIIGLVWAMLAMFVVRFNYVATAGDCDK